MQYLNRLLWCYLAASLEILAAHEDVETGCSHISSALWRCLALLLVEA